MVLALAKDEAADHDPLRVADAARPRPLAVEPVAAGRDLGLAGGGGRGGDAGVAVLAPHVVLRLVGEMREDAGVVAEIVQAPGRRAAGGAAELDGDIERDLVVVLVAVPALGHDRAHEAGVDIFLDRLARDVAVALGLDRALAQLRRQRAGAPHQLLAARNASPAQRTTMFPRHSCAPPLDYRPEIATSRSGLVFAPVPFNTERVPRVRLCSASPACGEGLGVGVDVSGRISSNSYDPPPQPSPTPELGFTRVRHSKAAEVGYIRLRLGEGADRICRARFRPARAVYSPAAERMRSL